VNILLVSFWRRILVASSFHCQRFRGQERITAKGKRNPVSAPTVFQRRSQSTRKMPGILSEEKDGLARSVFPQSKETLENTIFFVFFLHSSLFDCFVSFNFL